MAQKQVGARTEGDVYQGLFFWRQAAELLRNGSRVQRVTLEHDAADGVDDVAVFYGAPGVDAGGWTATADFFQLKYHVDHRDGYSADALIDPKFVRGKSSLLQRFHHAYQGVKNDHEGFRLHLASNWRWKDDDKLAQCLREFDGALPDRFFTDGPRSDLGKTREAWREHLGLEVSEFESFARTLRLQLDHFGRRDFRALVQATLEAAGLVVPSADHASCPYESLVQQFLMNGPNSFDRETLLELCRREGLLREAGGTSEPGSIGVRSFVRFAERLDDEVDELACISERFEGRHPRTEDAWLDGATAVVEFLGDPDRRGRLRAREHSIALECHGSYALLAGYELSRNSGVQVFPIQKPGRQVWRPTVGEREATPNWQEEVVDGKNSVDDIAICLSATHEIGPDVLSYLKSQEGPSVGRVIILRPDTGPGAESIRGADHAYALASELVATLSRLRSSRTARVHLFFACPNALAYAIGQHREGLGQITVYEFDFGFERTGTYQPSIALPLGRNPRQDQGGES